MHPCLCGVHATRKAQDEMTSSTRVEIRRLPDGHIAADDFRLTEAVLPPVGPGQVQVRNGWMSLDPYMRLGLTPQDSFVAKLAPGDILQGPAIGVVERSCDAAFPEGAQVLSQMGWRSHFVADAGSAALSRVDGDVPAEWHLGLLGLTGITAWLGIEDILQPTAGEMIFISGAAGAVGSIACQLAKRRGARVLASAGSDEKAAWLVREIGVDAVVDYRTRSIEAFVEEECPGGVDCYFDNVGGDMLERFLTLVRPGGRIGLCGAISQYEKSDYRRGPGNFFAVIENGLSLRGFNAFRLTAPEWAEIAGHLKALALNGDLKPCQTIVEGIGKVPEAFAGMFGAGQCGKLVVRI